MKFKHTKLCICAVLITLLLSAHIVRVDEVRCDEITTDIEVSEAAYPSASPQCILGDLA